jgi:hypothetical protein
MPGLPRVINIVGIKSLMAADVAPVIRNPCTERVLVLMRLGMSLLGQPDHVSQDSCPKRRSESGRISSFIQIGPHGLPLPRIGPSEMGVQDGRLRMNDGEEAVYPASPLGCLGCGRVRDRA